MLELYKLNSIELFDNQKKRFTAAQVKAATGKPFVINGGFFDNRLKTKTYLQPYCPLKIDGNVIVRDTDRYFVYAWNKGEMPVVEVSTETARQNYIACVMMIVAGQKQALHCSADVAGLHIRKAFGFLADGTFVALRDSTLMTPEEAQDIMFDAGCVSAILCDGGGSAQEISPFGTEYSSRIVSNFICADVTPIRQIATTVANLKLGSRGDAVKVLQTSLNKLGYNCGEPDGIFGAMTRKAVIAFQTAHGLGADGVAGKLTQATINAQLGTVPKPSTVTTITAEAAELKAKAEKVLEFIQASVGDLYVYGAQGQTDIVTTVNWSARCFPTYTTAARAARMKAYAAAHPVKANGQPIKCEDCSGLFWAAENQVELPFGKFDVDDSAAESLYSLYCDPVKKSELRPLDFVFAGNPISHVAVVGYDGKIYEAAGSDIGVVCNDTVDDRTMTSIFGGTYTKAAWTKYGRLKILRDIELKSADGH